jgi:glycerol-3-phosphate dehydrogenase
LLKDGRGLVNPLTCLVASYTQDTIPRWAYGLGLSIYDLLALKFSHRGYDEQAIQSLCPVMCPDGLQGGFRFADAQTDDARLVLRVIQEAVQLGGLALNYAPVTGLLRLDSGRTAYLPRLAETRGRVSGVIVCDAAPGKAGRTQEVRARAVVNATGAWADTLRQQVGGQARLRKLRGSHLVFPLSRLPLTRAFNAQHPADGRPVFALPWEGLALVGTTDVDHTASLDQEPRISAAEQDYLMQFVNRFFPSQELTHLDLQATYSGIRPVVNTGKADPSRESREHVIWNESGLLTITGGKLTTFRRMAHQALKRLGSLLPEQVHFDPHRSLFTKVSIDEIDWLGVSPEQRLRLTGRYGIETQALLSASAADELAPVASSNTLWAELRWAARTEAIVHLDDLLLRRVRLGLLLPMGGLPWIQRIRAIAQPELAWDDRRFETELAAYQSLWSAAYSA